MRYLLIAIFMLSIWSGAALAQAKLGVPSQRYFAAITSSTPQIVVPIDTSNVSWKVQAMDNSIMCTSLRKGQTISDNAPSTTNGFMVVGAGVPLTSLPSTDPTYGVACIAVSTSAKVSVWIDTKQ